MAMDPTTNTSMVVGAAYLVGKRLGVADLTTWAEKEAYGYKNDDNVPEYRKVIATLVLGEVVATQGSVTLRRWREAVLDPELDYMKDTNLIGSVSLLEQLAQSEKPQDFETNYDFMRYSWFGMGKRNVRGPRIGRRIYPRQFARVIEQVRKVALDWSLDLQSQGITGPGLTIGRVPVPGGQPGIVFNPTVIASANGDVTMKNIKVDSGATISQSNLVNADSIKDSFKQTYSSSAVESADLAKLSAELELLKREMQKSATETEHYVALGEIAKAQQAAANNDPKATAGHIKAAGKWALDVATKIGVGIATDVIKETLGL